jgi:hypothetical protein
LFSFSFPFLVLWKVNLRYPSRTYVVGRGNEVEPLGCEKTCVAYIDGVVDRSGVVCTPVKSTAAGFKMFVPRWVHAYFKTNEILPNDENYKSDPGDRLLVLPCESFSK